MKGPLMRVTRSGDLHEKDRITPEGCGLLSYHALSGSSTIKVVCFPAMLFA